MKQLSQKNNLTCRHLTSYFDRHYGFILGIITLCFLGGSGGVLVGEASDTFLYPSSLIESLHPAQTLLQSPYENQSKITSLQSSFDPQLQKLALYKKTILGNYGSEMMVFLHFPTTRLGAERLALNMNNLIQEYRRNHIRPLFLFEPFDEGHQEIDFQSLKNGVYTQVLDRLFLELKSTYQLTQDEIGVLIPYPELNTPAYIREGFEPKDFATLINLFFASARSYFPGVEGGLLLDSKSYDTTKKWGEGAHTSFMPYISDIAPGTIQRLGIQGFPWVSNDGKIKAYSPKVYLPYTITLEAAKHLGVQSIWFNTGVMRKKYSANTVIVPPETTSSILRATLLQAKRLKAKGYTISMNLFTQNKFEYIEATDWGFLGDEKYEKIMRGFFQSAEKGGVGISIYDK